MLLCFIELSYFPHITNVTFNSDQAVCQTQSPPILVRTYVPALSLPPLSPLSLPSLSLSFRPRFFLPSVRRPPRTRKALPNERTNERPNTAGFCLGRGGQTAQAQSETVKVCKSGGTSLPPSPSHCHCLISWEIQFSRQFVRHCLIW